MSNDDYNMYDHTVGNWARVVCEEAHLEAEEEAVAKLEQEAFACWMRIRKQQKVLCEKAGKMLQHDLYTIEALEEFEAKEKQLEEERLENKRVEKENELASASIAGPNNELDFDPSLPSLSAKEIDAWLANKGISNGTVQSI